MNPLEGTEHEFKGCWALDLHGVSDTPLRDAYAKQAESARQAIEALPASIRDTAVPPHGYVHSAPSYPYQDSLNETLAPLTLETLLEAWEQAQSLPAPRPILVSPDEYRRLQALDPQCSHCHLPLLPGRGMELGCMCHLGMS